MPDLNIDIDTFSSGQISSKIWLCEELEKLKLSTPPVVWVYGGWNGLLSFLILSRNNFPVTHIRSFDIDVSCEKNADTINGNWVWKEWKFKAFTIDCDLIDLNSEQYGKLPNIIINTSSEHFKTTTWFDNIPVNTIVVIQSNNMPHDDHYSCVTSIEEMKAKYQMREYIFEGNLDFKYPTWSFSRYMLIGVK